MPKCAWSSGFLTEGFFLFAEVSRNDSCSDLPEIQNGWKTTSHTELVREAKITYQCDPGYDIVGSDTLTCQWDLSWSSEPPFCEKSTGFATPGLEPPSIVECCKTYQGRGLLLFVYLLSGFISTPPSPQWRHKVAGIISPTRLATL